MKKHHAERAFTLIDFLNKVPRAAFDIESWYFQNDLKTTPEQSVQNKARFNKGDDPKKLHKDCGTTACALGWACSIPELRRKGLYLDYRESPALRGKFGLLPTEVGAEFFGITDGESHELFIPDLVHYKVNDFRQITPKMVAKKFEALVNSYGWVRA